MVKNGKITKEQAKKITEKSLGMAQVDKREDRLGSKQIKFVDKTAVDPKTTYLDKVISKISDNTAASSKEIKQIKEGFNFAKDNGRTYEKTSEMLRKVAYSEARKEVAPSAAPQVLEKKPVENDKPTTVPNGSEVVFKKNEIGYKPFSERDGNALVHLPLRLSDKISRVDIVDLDGKVLATALPEWKELDGSGVARFKTPGNTFAKSFKITFHFLDGSKNSENIENGETVYSRII